MTSATPMGSSAETRTINASCWRGLLPGQGGFVFRAAFGLDKLQPGMRGFVGMDTRDGNNAGTDPLTNLTESKLGMAINDNVGSWSLVRGSAGASPFAQSLGAGFPIDITSFYELILECPQNASSISWTVKNLSSGATATGVWTTDLPAAGTFFRPKIWLNNYLTADSVTFSAAYLRTMTPWGSIQEYWEPAV